MICDVRHQGTYCREGDTGHSSHGAGCPHHPTIICHRHVAVLFKTIKITGIYSTDITFMIKHTIWLTQSHTRPAGTAEIQVPITQYSYYQFFSSAHLGAKSERNAIGELLEYIISTK